MHYHDSHSDAVFPWKNDSKSVWIVKYDGGSKTLRFHPYSVLVRKGPLGCPPNIPQCILRQFTTIYDRFFAVPFGFCRISGKAKLIRDRHFFSEEFISNYRYTESRRQSN